MQKTLPIKLIITVLVSLLLIWWLWPAASPQSNSSPDSLHGETQLVSAIQPKTETSREKSGEDTAAELTTSREVSSGWQAASNNNQLSDEAFKRKFDEALEAHSRSEYESAIAQFNQLVSARPSLVEPYINLATAYAANGQLDLARQALLQGMSANPNYATLFTNLQKLHGVLAANAYHSALAEDAQSVSMVALPAIASIDFAQENSLAAKNAQKQFALYQGQLEKITKELNSKTEQLQRNQIALNESKAQVDKMQASLTLANSTAEHSASAQSTVIALQQELESANQKFATMRADLQTQLAQLQSELDEKSVVATRETALRQQQRLALAQQQSERLAALQEQEVKAKQALEQQQAERLAKQQAAKQQQNLVDQKRAAQEAQAKELVRSWAQAWSDQNVPAYVAHYADNYQPAGGKLSHAVWLSQRQIRLTNKSFINVTVSNFKVQKEQESMPAQRFSVTFTQRYQSNTMDDTISKQLTFEVPGDDWNNAKIVAERVIR